jgi:polyisoprenyl-phosphate glycosyltransferase
MTTLTNTPELQPRGGGELHGEAAVALAASIVLPCYNEAGHVEAEIERITAAMDADGMAYELIVIDDASTDGTLDVLRSVAARFRTCGS